MCRCCFPFLSIFLDIIDIFMYNFVIFSADYFRCYNFVVIPLPLLLLKTFDTHVL
jgi:hypothetical protein